MDIPRVSAAARRRRADRARELREEDARRAKGPGPGLPDPARTEPVAVSAAGTTRFGERNRRGTAASFRCAQCGDVTGAVRVARANPAIGTRRLPGREPNADGLVLDFFLGTSWRAEGTAILDAVQELIEQGNVDPIAIPGDQLVAVGRNAVLLPRVQAQLLQRPLGHLRRLQYRVLGLHYRNLPERAPAPRRLTSFLGHRPGHATGSKRPAAHTGPRAGSPLLRTRRCQTTSGFVAPDATSQDSPSALTCRC
jgi:hypothetical protein